MQQHSTILRKKSAHFRGPPPADNIQTNLADRQPFLKWVTDNTKIANRNTITRTLLLLGTDYFRDHYTGHTTKPHLLACCIFKYSTTGQNCCLSQPLQHLLSSSIQPEFTTQLTKHWQVGTSCHDIIVFLLIYYNPFLSDEVVHCSTNLGRR